MGIGTKFGELFSKAPSSGARRSDASPSIHVSSNGTSTVSPEQLKRIVLRSFKEMTPGNGTPTGSDPTEAE